MWLCRSDINSVQNRAVSGCLGRTPHSLALQTLPTGGYRAELLSCLRFPELLVVFSLLMSDLLDLSLHFVKIAFILILRTGFHRIFSLSQIRK